MAFMKPLPGSFRHIHEQGMRGRTPDEHSEGILRVSGRHGWKKPAIQRIAGFFSLLCYDNTAIHIPVRVFRFSAAS